MRRVGFFLVFMLWASSASAVVITTKENGSWEVSTLGTLFAWDEDIITAQPWWGNPFLANEFAQLWADTWGGQAGIARESPLFAYGGSSPYVWFSQAIQYKTAVFIDLSTGTATEFPGVPSLTTGFIHEYGAGTYAVAVPARAVPEPSILSLLILSLAGLRFAHSRNWIARL